MEEDTEHESFYVHGLVELISKYLHDKAIYRFNTTTIKMPTTFFSDSEKNLAKIHMETPETLNS